MEDFNVKDQVKNAEKKPRTFWKTFGMIFLSVLLAVLTIVVINS